MIIYLPRHRLTLVHAALSLGSIGPHTGAGVLVKVQSVGARELHEVSVDAVVELVADGRIWMSEESVASRAVAISLGCLQFSAVSAVNVEGLVAFVNLANRHVKDQTIGTQFL